MVFMEVVTKKCYDFTPKTAIDNGFMTTGIQS